MAKRITTTYEALELKEEAECNTPATWRDELVGYYVVRMRGLCQHMASDAVTAIFGSFEKVGRGLVEYSATVWQENGEIYHPYHSEFLDDLNWLQAQ